MLAGSGPSATPTSFGQILARGGMAGLEGYQGAEQAAFDRALQKMKVSSLVTKQQEEKQLKDIMGLPQQEQISALQRLGRYDLIKNLAESQQALRKAGLTRTEGEAEMPSPFAVYLNAQSPNVRELAKTYDTGFRSGRIDEDTADKRLADLARMEESFIGRKESAADRALAREEKRLQGTEGQNLSSGFASRMVSSNAIVNQLEDLQSGNLALVLPTEKTSTAAGVPLFGGYLQRKVMTPEQQQYKQAADNWIRANLRKESGAAIPPEEMRLEYETYFPLPGESAAVVEQKRQAREETTKAMIKNAGPVYTPVDTKTLPSILSIRKRFNLE